MASYWDTGLETSIYHLEQVATTSGNADFQTRAKALETRLKNQSFPVFQSISIKGDALQLGYDIAAATNTGSNGGNSDGKNNVLFDENTLGGAVAGNQEGIVSGDVGANVGALASDVGSTASDEAASVAHAAQQLASGAAPYVGPLLAKITQVLYIFMALLIALAVLYTYEKGKS